MTCIQTAGATPLAPAISPKQQNVWSVIAAMFRPDPIQRKTRKLLRELKELEDHQLNDIGLARSDLTEEGLSNAAKRRALRQDQIAAELARMPIATRRAA